MTLDNQPIPWAADAVLVTAVLDLPQPVQVSKGDFVLRAAGTNILPESQRVDDTGETIHVQFRLRMPEQAGAVELTWRGRSLGQVALPILSPDEFVKKLSVQMPTASVRIGAQTVACQAYVTTQCQGLIASAVLSSPTSLVPILDLGMHVEMRRQEGGPVASVPVQLSSSQLRARQALVSVVPPKPKRMGTWQLTWHVGDRPLATQTLKAISQKQFFRSLRVAATRFVLQDGCGGMRVERLLHDTEDVARIGPCFLVSSSEAGMAAWCILQVRAHLKGAGQAPLLQEQEVLLTDGPFPFVPGTLPVGDLSRLKHFELWSGRDLLGTLPLTPVPTAAFTKEGGFVAPDTFEWSATAEEQLKERMEKLLES